MGHCERETRPIGLDHAPRGPIRIGTLPRVGALDQLRGANGDGIIERARSNPRLVVAIAAGAILLLTWIGWAIYVTSSHGASAGLGVVIAWPAMLAALALISLPFIGGYLLIRKLSEDSGSTATAETAEAEDEDDDDSDEESEDTDDDQAEDSEEDEDEQDEEDSEEEDEADEESDDESESEPEASAKS
jgi:hypothetical protein